MQKRQMVEALTRSISPSLSQDLLPRLIE
jgi:hypothetical protein